VEAVNLKKTLIEDLLKVHRSIIDSIRYGSVTIVIQDGKVVRIEKNEKIRLV